MCGINAVFKYSSVTHSDRERISRMNASMAYRGPDDEGVWSDATAALGMRRLSIVGLTNGHQPLFSEDKSMVLVCNGEIYNYPELRQLSEKKGHCFSTNSDCEVILHLYEDYGETCVEYLRGMFAFVLWDTNKKRMVVGRDRLGEKPLYYTEFPSGIVFSSELKAIAESWVVDPEPDWGVLRQTFEYGYGIDTHRTMVDRIRRVAPGEFMVVNENGPKCTQYWRAEFEPTYIGTKRQAMEELKAKIEESVTLRLQSDVPVAILLSGGIDSSLIAHILSKKRHQITAITAGYKGAHDCDERSAAKKFADHIRIAWRDIELNSGDFKSYFEEFMSVVDEPIGDIASFAQWGIYKKSAEMGFKVLLSGIGGDELFFGYPLHNRRGRTEEARRQFDKYLPLRGRKSTLKLALATLFKPAMAMDIINYALHEPSLGKKPSWFDEFPQYGFNTNFEELPRPNRLYESITGNGYDQVYAGLINSWLWGNCLSLADKLGMGASVEVRCPFVDHVLLEFIYSLPVEWRISLKTSKRLLRELYKDELPDWVLNARKRGFAPPLDFVKNLVNSHKSNQLQGRVNSYTEMILSRLFDRYFPGLHQT